VSIPRDPEMNVIARARGELLEQPQPSLRRRKRVRHRFVGVARGDHGLRPLVRRGEETKQSVAVHPEMLAVDLSESSFGRPNAQLVALFPDLDVAGLETGEKLTHVHSSNSSKEGADVESCAAEGRSCCLRSSSSRTSFTK